MMGVVLERPFPTYPHGFPPEVMEPFERGHRTAACSAIFRPRAPASSTNSATSTWRRPADRLHVRRFRLPDRLSRGRRARARAVSLVRDRARHPAGPPRRRAGDRAPVRRRLGSLRAHAAPPRLLAGAAGPDVSRPAARARRAGRRRRQDRRDLRAARRRRGRPHHRQHRRHRRLHPPPSRRWTRACCSPIWSTSTRCGVTATTWPASPRGWPPLTWRWAYGGRCCAPTT